MTLRDVLLPTGHSVGDATPVRTGGIMPFVLDFWRRRTSWQRLAPVAIVTVARIHHGRFTRNDVAAVSAAALVYGPAEWIVHRSFLHTQPLGPLRPATQSPAAIAHRAHHADPDDLEILFKPVPNAAVGPIIVALGSASACRRWPAQASAAATFSGLVAVYHWTHFLFHCDWTPRSQRLRRARANHLSHHHDSRGLHRMGTLVTWVDELAERVAGRPPD